MTCLPLVSFKSFDIYFSNYCHFQMVTHIFVLCKSPVLLFMPLFCFYSWKLPLSGLPGGFCTYPELISMAHQNAANSIWSREEAGQRQWLRGEIGRLMTTVTYSDQTKQKATFCSHRFRTSNARILTCFAKSIAELSSKHTDWHVSFTESLFLKIIHITQYFRTDKMPISESIWDLSCRKCLKGMGGPFNCAKISKYIIHPLSLFSVFNT